MKIISQGYKGMTGLRWFFQIVNEIEDLFNSNLPFKSLYLKIISLFCVSVSVCL